MGNFPANLGLIRVYPFLSYHVVLVNCRLKLTGTTASGVICRQGCVVGCDKRSSNESSRVERKKSWKPKIRDYNYKGRALTKHLVCIMLGDSVTAGVLLHFVEQQVKSRLSAPDLVRKTDQIAKQYIEINPNEEVSYGLLIAGYDKEVHEDCNGIHIFAIQIAKRMGATVYVSSRKENNRYENCNADFVVDFDDYNNLVREATGEEKGVDVILQSRVSTHFEKNLSCLETGGRLISLGTCSLDIRDGFDTFPDTIPPDIPKIYWLSAASFWRRDQESKARIVAEVKEYVWPLIEAGNGCPVFPCRLFPFSEANEAYMLMKSEMTSHNNIGKCHSRRSRKFPLFKDVEDSS